MNILKKSITRTIALVIALISIFYCSFNLLISLRDYWGVTRGYDEKYTYPLHSQLNDEFCDLSSDLWLIGSMYIRRLDAEGNFVGNEYLKKSVEQNLRQRGLMDENGNILFPKNDIYGYSITALNYQYFSENLTKNEDANYYTFRWERDNRRTAYYMNYNYSWNDYMWYDNLNGMEYYYQDGKGYAVYDYDTKGLNSYTDELGAVIYLNADGTTPIPYIYNSFSDLYTSFDAEKYESNLYTDIEPYSQYCKNFTMTICPTDEVIAEIDADTAVLIEAEQIFTNQAVKLIPFAAIAALLFLYVLIAGGWDEKKKKFTLEPLGRIWTELYLALGFVCAFGLVALLEYGYEVATLEDTQNYGFSDKEINLIFAFAATVAILVLFECINVIVIKLKCRSLIKTTFIGKAISRIFRKTKEINKRIKESYNDKQAYKNNIFTRRFIIRILIFFASEFLVSVFIMVIGEETLLILLLLPFIYLFWFTYKDLKELTKIGKRIDKIIDGDYSSEEVPKDSVIYGFNEKLNNITDGIGKTVESQVRSEKMKIELVTNVSHDLKTPLTSIISYVDLLSQEKLNPEARDYVNIIQTKTERLKEIVSDVFDLAKATSKTDVKLELLDAVVLVNQVIGDMQDTINNAPNKFCADILISEAKIMAEGKKMYRVLQNVIDNALKYSLSGTRIFMKVSEENKKVIIELKNTASYEMKFTADEITERFKRGDESRNSEGNGLGLSIAKSFTEACNGIFEVEIDGDLFIVRIALDIIE